MNSETNVNYEKKLQYLNEKKYCGNIFYALQINVELIFCSYYKNQCFLQEK